MQSQPECIAGLCYVGTPLQRAPGAQAQQSAGWCFYANRTAPPNRLCNSPGDARHSRWLPCKFLCEIMLTKEVSRIYRNALVTRWAF